MGSFQEGVIVQPSWTKKAQSPAASSSAGKVIVNESALKAAQALRSEINQAVAVQGQTEQVRQLEAEFKTQQTAGKQGQAAVGSAQQEMLGASMQQEEPAPGAERGQTNIVDAAPLDIDLAQLQQLQLSKRRTREMLVLDRIVENLEFTLGSDVFQWLQLLHNGSIYFVGARSAELMLLQQQNPLADAAAFRSFAPAQTLPFPAGIDSVVSFDRWNTRTLQQESLVLLATQQQLLWYRLELGLGLAQFWQWPLGSQVNRLLPFVVENREYVVLMHNHTLNIYAYDVDNLEFWVVQRLQLEQSITALAVLDTGRDLLLAVGQADEALVYAHNVRDLPPDAGLHLQLRQRLEAPQIADISAFQMGGRSYLALGGLKPQILAYVQGQLLPRTVLGQNFGRVELFLPVPVRSYRDDLLLLVQHRVYFDTHSLLQLEVLVWNGEHFEASLPAPCEVGQHMRHGASCMLDELRDVGIVGAALVRQVQPPLLLVPRQAAPSGLFRLHTQLLPRNSELRDLQEIHDFMRKWVEEQDKLLQLAEQQLHAAEAESQAYEEVHTPLLVNEGALLGALLVNGEAWTAADAGVNMLELLHQIRLLNQQLAATRHGSARVRRQAQLFRFDYEQLDFDVVEAQELLVEQLNHVPFYIQNATLQFNGTLNVQRLELLERPVRASPESLPSSTRELLQLAGDLSCEYINGLEWTQFLQQLVLRDEPLQLSQLQVQGAVVFEDSLHLSALNELSFPDDYLWSQSSSTSVVRAPKQFTQTLTVNAVDTAGTINGRDPLDAITLSDAQDWPGSVTFSQLEVSEELQLNGSAQGRQFEQAPLNPTVLEANHIHAACHFAHLVVNGPLLMRGSLDNQSFDALFGDFVQRPRDANEELLIPGAKHAQHLALPVDAHVSDGRVSGIPLEKFVNKHTEQTLHNVSQLHGYVYFHRLRLSGAYDGVRLEQLLQQALHVDAPLLASTTRLHFVNGLQLPQLHVTSTLNDVPLSTGYQTLHEPLYLGEARFERLQAEQLDVTHDVTGGGQLNGRTLNEVLLNAPRLDHVQVQELILPMGVEAAQLQGLNAKRLLQFLEQLDELPLLILHGQLQVQQIAVSGGVQVLGPLNGRDMAQLQREVVWLDQANELRTRWRLQQSPLFANDLLLQGSYNQRLLPELLNDVVFRSSPQQELIIMGTKNFVGNVRVLDTLRLHALNGIPFEKLANRLQPLNFAGDVRLEGRLYVENLQLQDQLNGREVSRLQERLLWHPQLYAFVQRGQISLPQLQLQELSVQGHLGNRSLEPLREFFADVLDKREKQLKLEGNKIFTGRVSIQGGAHIAQLNGVQLEQLLSELIFIDDEEVTVHTPVRFEAPVQMKLLQAEHLILQGDRLNGCNISEWIHDTIRVDRDWQAEAAVGFASGALDKNTLQVAQLNHLNLSHIVTLHTPQNLSFPLLARELHLKDQGQVQLEGPVNGRNLSEEYANTLLTHAPYVQRVQTPLVMQSILVNGSLTANAPINGNSNLNLSDVATLLEEPLCLQTPLYFERLHAPELRTRFHINGFDYNAWHERSLWAVGRPTQVVSGNWSVRWLRVKQPPPAAEIPHEVYRRQTAAAWAGRYKELCERLARLFGLLQLPYQVTKLRRSFELRQATDQPDVRRVFALKSAAKNSNYLLINELGCWTRIHRWNRTHYAPAGAFESGPIDEVTVLHVRNESSANASDQFSFMTSYELGDDEELDRSWNCSSLQNLQSWRTSAHIEIEPLDVSVGSLQRLQQQHEAKQLQRRLPSYQHAIKYLHQPSVESQLRPHLDATHALGQEQYETLRRRLLEHLGFRLQTEVNITQLSIPESDLFDDEHLVEDFLWLMRQLQRHASRSGSRVFASLPTDTLPLPSNPASVLAARSAQLIWPVLQELMALHKRLAANESEVLEQQHELILQLELTVRDVLLLANDGNLELHSDGADENALRLHAVIGRLRQLQQVLHELQQSDERVGEGSDREEAILPPPEQRWQHVQTIRLYVGPAHRATLLYARLSLVAPETPPVAPSSAPAAHIQLHHANGTLFQSLAANERARQLTTLRVRDETLLAFVEACCRVRVFIYRGVQGFVPFAEFQAENKLFVMQLLAMRLPLQRPPGALYTLAVVQARRVIFYELVIPGLFEPWLQCRNNIGL
ncbi:hypothetical protein KR222_011636 [Zaprionus bogoriensis]|nr:hypothetical protein KR222_011636 [Zaprionus bogoriensis]